MTKVFKDIKLGIDENLKEKLECLVPQFSDFRILKQSVDARQRHNPHFVYSIEIAGPHESLGQIHFELEKTPRTPKKNSPEMPIIIGTGPAGLFAALRLCERGIPSVIFERGSQAEKRIMGINHFWRYGQLDPRNNVCFGEGGAGLYSDGKLITRIKSEHIPYVMNRLVRFGAPKEIEYLSNPHVGSDKIRRIIPKIRNFLLEQGCVIHYDTRITDFITEGRKVIGVTTEHQKNHYSSHVVLATGHSADDIFQALQRKEIFMEGKSFALGVRIEHPQELINKIQYRDYFNHPKLGSANYKLTYHDEKTNTGVYSFCMCPGGFVLSSGTEADGVVCNGMSNFHRNSNWANSAIVVTIDHEKWFKNDTWGGMKFRRELEHKAFQMVQKKGGNKQLPTQKLTDFLKRRSGDTLKGSSPSGNIGVNLHELLPQPVAEYLMTGVENFHTKMKGFITEQAQFYAVESRTSCPLRVTRDEISLQSLSHQNLYPTGEGAGYAGGITSAACDGVNVADEIYRQF
ncbi:MAG: hypothetical protein HUU56_12530 [Bdellovibrionaceae bacterium]|nr:hypothetical protein [Pseudobdellovibrionaceae bacterium]